MEEVANGKAQLFIGLLHVDNARWPLAHSNAFFFATPLPFPLPLTILQALQERIAFLTQRAKDSKAKGKALVALVTGANSGIGFTLAKLLAQAGVHVLLGCRHEGRGNEAVKKLQALVPGGAVELLLVDVADPLSTLAASSKLQKGSTGAIAISAATQGLDFLFLNAGIMPVDAFRWSVPIQAFLTGGLLYFLETGRASRNSKHFLRQPEDETVACGAPALFATHVLGHLLLAEELKPLLRLAKQHKGETGRVIWTSSRAASRPQTSWARLAPPASYGKPSGLQVQLEEKGHRATGESYGEAKFLCDCLNVRMGREGEGRGGERGLACTKTGSLMMAELLNLLLPTAREELCCFNMHLTLRRSFSTSPPSPHL